MRGNSGSKFIVKEPQIYREVNWFVRGARVLFVVIGGEQGKLATNPSIVSVI